MTCYSVQPRDQIFVKDCRLLSFAKNRGENIGKNVSRNLSSKYSQKVFDHAKQSATDPLKKASEKVIQRTAESIGDFSGNKIAYKTTKDSKNLPQSISETAESEI